MVCFDICHYICLDTSDHFSVLPSNIFFIFSSTLVLTFSIDVVFILSTKETIHDTRIFTWSQIADVLQETYSNPFPRNIVRIKIKLSSWFVPKRLYCNGCTAAGAGNGWILTIHYDCVSILYWLLSHTISICALMQVDEYGTNVRIKRF